MLQEKDRLKLDSIVNQMVANKESDENIQFVVNDFKNKYSQKQTTQEAPVGNTELPLVDRAINMGAKITDTIFGGGKIGEALAGGDVTGKELAGSALQSASLFFPAGRVAGAGAKIASKVGMGALSKTVGAVGAGAIGGYGFDVASNLQQNKEGKDILSPGLGTGIGAGIPAVGAALVGAKKAAQWAAPKLLSYTTDIPEQAFDTLIQRREPVMKALKEGVTADETLTQTRGAVRQLRKTLSQEWDDGVTSIADEFSTQRVGVAGDLEKKLGTLADAFDVRLPQNTKNASVVEWMDTLKSINELPKLMLTISPKGVVAREAKKELKDLIVKEFGGDKGSVATLYRNYSAKKTVFDAANQIVQAYSNGKPIQQSTAIGRLKALFNDNKSAYLDAILQLEKETGQDLLSRITALQFEQKLPRTGTVLSASGGLKSSKGPLDKALDLLLIPLTSPRSAAWITSALNKAQKAIPENFNIKTPGDVVLDKINATPNKQGGFAALPGGKESLGDAKYRRLNEEVWKERGMETLPNGMLRKIGEKVDDLTSEAKGKTLEDGYVYRGVKDDAVDGLNGRGGDWGNGTYYTTDPKMARVYGKNIQKATSLKDPFVFSYKNYDDLQNSVKQLNNKIRELGLTLGDRDLLGDKLTAVAKKLGKDGIKIDGQGIEVHFTKQNLVVPSVEKKLRDIGMVSEGDNMTTKEIASKLKISTQSAYKMMSDLEKQGNAYKVGYRTRDGWEDPSYSGLHTNSLSWSLTDTWKQANPEASFSPEVKRIMNMRK